MSEHIQCSIYNFCISEYAPMFTAKETFYDSIMRSSPMGILLPTRFPGFENSLDIDIDFVLLVHTMYMHLGFSTY